MSQPSPEEAEKLALAADRIKPKYSKGRDANFLQAEWYGEDTSGLRVFGKNILVKMDQVHNELSETNYVLHTDEVVERLNATVCTGCIYAIGPEAFRVYSDGERWTGDDKPRIGERVYIQKFSGIVAIGQDGGFYRIMDYDCVAAGLAAGATRVEG